MNKGYNKEFGDIGEDIAVKFLVRKNFEIIERNYRFGQGEIDIIAKDGDSLVFIEVKTRTSDKFGSPEDAVSKRKLYQIKKIAEGYLSESDLDFDECRLDVIGVIMHGKNTKINHIENAYSFYS